MSALTRWLAAGAALGLAATATAGQGVICAALQAREPTAFDCTDPQGYSTRVTLDGIRYTGEPMAGRAALYGTTGGARWAVGCERTRRVDGVDLYRYWMLDSKMNPTADLAARLAERAGFELVPEGAPS